MSSTTSCNKHTSNHQSSSASVQSSTKNQWINGVVLHHPAVSPPPEDWILFPEEVIVTKHSSIREIRARNVKPALHSEKPSRSLPTPKETRVDSEKKVSAHTEPSRHYVFAGVPKQPFTTTKSVDGALWDDATKLSDPRLLQRLPTPDLSDVDEGDFWSCCGSSERSS